MNSHMHIPSVHVIIKSVIIIIIISIIIIIIIIIVIVIIIIIIIIIVIIMILLLLLFIFLFFITTIVVAITACTCYLQHLPSLGKNVGTTHQCSAFLLFSEPFIDIASLYLEHISFPPPPPPHHPLPSEKM